MNTLAPQYASQLAALLPEGPAWVSKRDSETTLGQLLAGLAPEAARIHGLIDALADEMDPRTTTALLSEWQRELGLPDACLTADTLQGWRRLLHTKLTALGLGTVQSYVDLAARLGYTITIQEFRPFRWGASTWGQPYNTGSRPWTWRVSVANVDIIRFRWGQSRWGEPYTRASDPLLECLFNRLKPAHTVVEFEYL